MHYKLTESYFDNITLKKMLDFQLTSKWSLLNNEY